MQAQTITKQSPGKENPHPNPTVVHFSSLAASQPSVSCLPRPKPKPIPSEPPPYHSSICTNIIFFGFFLRCHLGSVTVTVSLPAFSSKKKKKTRKTITQTISESLCDEFLASTYIYREFSRISGSGKNH